jgi:hypothetical protein
MSGLYAVTRTASGTMRRRSLPLLLLAATLVTSELKWILGVESRWIRFFNGLLCNLFEQDELDIEMADIGIANHEEEGLNRIEAMVPLWV